MITTRQDIIRHKQLMHDKNISVYDENARKVAFQCKDEIDKLLQLPPDKIKWGDHIKIDVPFKTTYESITFTISIAPNTTATTYLDLCRECFGIEPYYITVFCNSNWSILYNSKHVTISNALNNKELKNLNYYIGRIFEILYGICYQAKYTKLRPKFKYFKVEKRYSIENQRYAMYSTLAIPYPSKPPFSKRQACQNQG